MRMCIGCRDMKPKAELIRVVKTPEGEIELDTSGRKNGRGAYICKNAECLQKCRKRNSLSNTFSTFVSDSVYEKIEKEFALLEQ
ncbi:MAG: YlxR family protein [Clostridia bacterium]|nr:YlxR family protein [Clostridia bacterium]